MPAQPGPVACPRPPGHATHFSGSRFMASARTAQSLRRRWAPGSTAAALTTALLRAGCRAGVPTLLWTSSR